MGGFSHLGLGPGALPVTEHLAGEIVSLPMYASLDKRRQDDVVAAVRRVLGAP